MVDNCHFSDIVSDVLKVDNFWPTVLSVEPLVQQVVCRQSVCDVLYCGKKLSEGVNRKPGSKS